MSKAEILLLQLLLFTMQHPEIVFPALIIALVAAVVLVNKARKKGKT